MHFDFFWVMCFLSQCAIESLQCRLDVHSWQLDVEISLPQIKRMSSKHNFHKKKHISRNHFNRIWTIEFQFSYFCSQTSQLITNFLQLCDLFSTQPLLIIATFFRLSHFSFFFTWKLLDFYYFVVFSFLFFLMALRMFIATYVEFLLPAARIEEFSFFRHESLRWI